MASGRPSIPVKGRDPWTPWIVTRRVDLLTQLGTRLRALVVSIRFQVSRVCERIERLRRPRTYVGVRIVSERRVRLSPPFSVTATPGDTKTG